MDEGLGDEVAPIDVVETTHLLNKENEYSLKPLESSSLESREVLIPGEGDYPGRSFHMVMDILEGKDVNRSIDLQDASDHPCASPRYMDDAGNMVEELMVRDYDSNLAIVGTSNNRERIQTRQTQWQHLYQLGDGSGSGSSHGRNVYAGNGQSAPSDWEDERHLSFNQFLGQNTSSGGQQEAMELLPNAEIIEDSNRAISHQEIRTKILSKSGFSEFFIKNRLTAKGVIFRGPPHRGVRSELRDQHRGKAAVGTSMALDASPIPAAKTTIPSFGTAGPTHGGSDLDSRNLREWLNAGRHKANKAECLHIFRQIVDVVDNSHSQGIILHDLRPSSFKLLHSNQVKYLGPPVMKDNSEIGTDQDLRYSENCLIRRRPVQQGMFSTGAILAKKQKLSENVNFCRQWPQLTAKYGFANDWDSNFPGTKDSTNGHEAHLRAEDGNQSSRNRWLSNAAPQQLISVTDHSEEKWYLSPEELAGGICSITSNIYSLGVLLFELLCRFDSERARAMAMSDLCQRILPPHFLSENAKEAGFCLWLLHPEPLSRPTTREIQQSEVIGGLQEVFVEELSSSIEQDDAESDLLRHFLVSLGEHKQKHASKLEEDVRCLEKDIEEIVRRNYLKEPWAHACMGANFPDSNEPSFPHKEFATSEVLARISSSSTMKEVRFMSNMNQLESAYTTMRSKIQPPETGDTSREDKELLRKREREYPSEESEQKEISTDPLGNFFDGLCKYARYSKFEVRGLLRPGDFNSSANVICSLSFDRDAEYLAAAGISKKIKIFEFDALFNDSVDIHYPAIEMSNKSKLSCICWNSYIKNYLASTGYDGVVKLWDVSTGQGVFQFSEHEKRAWSVDFSPVCPTKFASGSDDCSVKLWSINEKNSFSTIRNIANVCCVQFSSHSTHLLAFGSADYKTYCYDLRNLRTPWCVLAGHDKAVSYVKFLDPETLVTASTDNSLKLWDLNKTSSIGVSSGACSSTLCGHTNEKNFVGLSVANGYIACGSETNEVYAYHRSLPMPITSHQFGSIDPISGKVTDDDNGQFVSNVCWRGDTDMIVAANSSGCIKVLQMV